MVCRLHSLAPAALVAAILLVAGCGGGSKSAGSVPASAVAVVGERTISKAELNELLAETKRRFKAKRTVFPKAGTADYRKIQGQAMQYLVEQSELEQKGAALGVKPITTQDVDVKLAQVKRQLFGEVPSDYAKELKQEGLTEATLRKDLREGILEDRLFAKVNAGTTVTDAEVRSFYNKHKTEYGHPATRVVRHILVSSRTLADTIEQKLRNGADFAALAQKYSQDPASAGNGGKITITQGQSLAEFEKAAFALKGNDVSAPVETRYGWHIIEAVGPVQAGSFAPLAAKEKQIRSQLLKTKKRTRWLSFLSDTKKEFAKTIRYRKGYAPASAGS